MLSATILQCSLRLTLPWSCQLSSNIKIRQMAIATAGGVQEMELNAQI